MNTQPKGHTLITGAVGGLGTAMVHRLLREGYSIIATDRRNDTALAALEKEHVAVAPVLTIPEVLQQPHFLERGAVRSVSDRVFGTLRFPGFPFRFTAKRESRPLIAPDLGEHNETVLT